MDEDVPDVVGPPRLEDQHAVRRVRREAVAERAAGGAPPTITKSYRPPIACPLLSVPTTRACTTAGSPAPEALPHTQPAVAGPTAGVREAGGRVRRMARLVIRAQVAWLGPGRAVPDVQVTCEGGTIVEVGRVRRCPRPTS